MMEAQEIINGLQRIVDKYSVFAIAWHAVLYVFIIALVAKWKPSGKLMALFMCLPLVSVAIFSWMDGNPFNGTMFSILAALVLVFGLKASSQPVSTSKLVFVIAGILMVAFGMLYPHFVDNTLLTWLHASPVGLIPCPTLSLIIGFALVYNGFGSRNISLLLTAFGLFYGIFGVFKLAVYLDLFLVFGSVMLFLSRFKIFQINKLSTINY